MIDNNKKIESLQDILENAKNEYQVTMKSWLYVSLITSTFVIGGIVYLYIENQGNLNTYHVAISAIIGTLKFLVIRQYTNAKKLVIETNNRLIASKLFANIANSKMDKEINTLIYPKVISSIIDSSYNQTSKDSSNDAGLNKLMATIKAVGKGK